MHVCCTYSGCVCHNCSLLSVCVDFIHQLRVGERGGKREGEGEKEGREGGEEGRREGG